MLVPSWPNDTPLLLEKVMALTLDELAPAETLIAEINPAVDGMEGMLAVMFVPS